MCKRYGQDVRYHQHKYTQTSKWEFQLGTTLALYLLACCLVVLEWCYWRKVPGVHESFTLFRGDARLFKILFFVAYLRINDRWEESFYFNDTICCCMSRARADCLERVFGVLAGTADAILNLLEAGGVHELQPAICIVEVVILGSALLFTLGCMRIRFFWVRACNTDGTDDLRDYVKLANPVPLNVNYHQHKFTKTSKWNLQLGTTLALYLLACCLVVMEWCYWRKVPEMGDYSFFRGDARLFKFALFVAYLRTNDNWERPFYFADTIFCCCISRARADRIERVLGSLAVLVDAVFNLLEAGGVYDLQPAICGSEVIILGSAFLLTLGFSRIRFPLLQDCNTDGDGLRDYAVLMQPPKVWPKDTPSFLQRGRAPAPASSAVPLTASAASSKAAAVEPPVEEKESLL